MSTTRQGQAGGQRPVVRVTTRAAAQTAMQMQTPTIGTPVPITSGMNLQITPQSPPDAQEEDETEEASEANDEDEDEELDEEEEQEEEEEPVPPPSPSLREISSLASWTVSTYKPGCGVKELLSPNNMLFWQSDGPQPHLLTIHFFKVVSIVRMRIYLNQDLDESYTPTHMVFAAGMGEHDLVEFADWKGENPRGWVEVELDGVGGRDSGRGYGGITANDSEDEDQYGEDRPRGDDDGKVLWCMCVQIRVLENHQNGKDTHVRGVQLFARDEKLRRITNRIVPVHQVKDSVENHPELRRLEFLGGMSDALLEPEWARDFGIR